MITQLKRPYDFGTVQEYLMYLLGKVEGADEVQLVIGWGSIFYDVRKMPATHTAAYRKVATRLYKRSNGDLVVQHKSTDVFTLHTDGSITLDNGGWATMTTHRIMNACLRQTPITVCRESYRTTVYPQGWSHPEYKLTVSDRTPVTIPA